MLTWFKGNVSVTITISPWFRCSGDWPDWTNARSRGRGRTEPRASPGRRCAHRPRAPPPFPPLGRRRPLARPSSLSPLRCGPCWRCAGRKDPRPGSSSPYVAGGAQAAPCSSWAGRGRSAAGSGPLWTPVGSPPGWTGCRSGLRSTRPGCSPEVCGWTNSRPWDRWAEGGRQGENQRHHFIFKAVPC